MLAAWRKHYKCVEALIAFQVRWSCWYLNPKFRIDTAQADPDLKDMHGFTAIGHSHKEDRMGVKLLWKWKLQVCVTCDAVV